MATNIKIFDNCYTNSQPGRDNGRWTRDNCHEDHNLTGFVVVEESHYRDLTVGFVPEYHQPYWLLVVHYDTGDSFHTDTGKVSFIDLYSKENVAYENEGLINAHLTLMKAYTESNRYLGKKWPENKPAPGYTISLVLDDNTAYEYYAGEFLGYFETVTSVEVIELMRRNENDFF